MRVVLLTDTSCSGIATYGKLTANPMAADMISQHCALITTPERHRDEPRAGPVAARAEFRIGVESNNGNKQQQERPLLGYQKQKTCSTRPIDAAVFESRFLRENSALQHNAVVY